MPDLNTAFPMARFVRAGTSSGVITTLQAAWALLSPAVQDAENTFIEGLSDLQVATITSFPVSGGAIPAPQAPSGQLVVVNSFTGGDVAPWAALTSYTAGTQVTQAGQLYAAKTSFTSAGTWAADASNWQLLGVNAVPTVFGRTGAITAQPGDYNATQVPAVPGLLSNSATPTITIGAATHYWVTGLAQAITGFVISGTPGRGTEFWVELQDNGTSKAIAWGAAFGATNVPLPTQTIPNQLLSVLFKFNTVTSLLEPVAVIGGLPRGNAALADGVMAPYDVDLLNNAVAPGSANLHGVRVTAPKTGILHDITLWNGGVATGNLILSVYDTGQATAGTRTRLATSGAIASSGVTNSWMTPVWDPAIQVIEGEQYDFAVQADNATATYGRSNGANVAQSLLPANYLKPGAYDAPDPTVNPYKAFFIANTFANGHPATLPDTGLTGDFGYMIIGRVA